MRTLVPSSTEVPTPVADPSKLVDVEGLAVTFESERGPVRAVHDVDLLIAPGTTVGLVGESGSGKSVTARTLMGLVPKSVAQVRARKLVVAGTDLLSADAGQMRQLRGGLVSMVFQDPMRSLNPTMSIGKQIGEMIVAHEQVTTTEVRRRVIELLDAVRIPAARERAEAFPHQLSGGMRQRAMIAMALAARPRLVIADEPTTALDVTVQAQILGLLGELQREFGMAILLVTHDLAVASSYTERINIMYAGRIVESGETRAVLGEMRMPYTRGLFESIPGLDSAPGTELRAIPGAPPDPATPIDGCAFASRCERAIDRCAVERPPVDGHDGHSWSCWAPLEVPQNVAAKEVPR